VTRLPGILERAGRLPAIEVVGVERLEPGRIHVAAPDRHLVVEPGTVRSVVGPKENRHRPSIDVLFRSAAATYGSRVVAVVLTGALGDGTAGLVAVHEAGGLTVVQDPDEAAQPSMPMRALREATVDHCLPIAGIATLLRDLTAPAAVATTSSSSANAKEPGTGAEGSAPPVAFACPDCNGTLWQVREGDVVRYQCRVGHAYSPEALQVENHANLERALWTALRILEERAALQRHLAESARSKALHGLETMYLERARTTESDAATLRRTVLATLGRQGPETA
jgi:two-component system, chemotaxis family, protein-glutamate methylesterase/glutaminase